MKVFNTKTGQVKRPRRRIGEVPRKLVAELKRMSREERVKIEIAAAMSALSYGVIE